MNINNNNNNTTSNNNNDNDNSINNNNNNANTNKPKTFKSRFDVNKLLGEGSFSKIYEATDLLLDKKVALKMEKEDKSKKILKHEYEILKNLQRLDSVPKIYDFIDTCNTNNSNKKNNNNKKPINEINKPNFIVMELKGVNISNYKKIFNPNKFYIINILKDIVSIIENVHNLGYIHRDIKPSNFVLDVFAENKINNNNNNNFKQYIPKVFIIDFGLAKHHLDKLNNAFPMRKNTDFRGTLTYASLNAHLKKDLGRRDDLFSFFFMALDLLGEKIPWRDCLSLGKDESNKENIKKAKDLSLKKPEMFLVLESNKYHDELMEVFNHINSLAYEDKPNYELIKKAFEKILMKESNNLLGINDNPQINNINDINNFFKNSIYNNNTNNNNNNNINKPDTKTINVFNIPNVNVVKNGPLSGNSNNSNNSIIGSLLGNKRLLNMSNENSNQYSNNNSLIDSINNNTTLINIINNIANLNCLNLNSNSTNANANTNTNTNNSFSINNNSLEKTILYNLLIKNTEMINQIKEKLDINNSVIKRLLDIVNNNKSINSNNDVINQLIKLYENNKNNNNESINKIISKTNNKNVNNSNNNNKNSFYNNKLNQMKKIINIDINNDKEIKLTEDDNNNILSSNVNKNSLLKDTKEGIILNKFNEYSNNNNNNNSNCNININSNSNINKKRLFNVIKD